ncbi:MAG: S41 family peptidase [Candidatus Berkelbacteria bacterium]
MDIKNRTNRGKLVTIIVVFIVALGVMSGVFLFGYSYGRQGKSIGIISDGLTSTEVGKPKSVDFSLFWQAWNKLEEKSVVAPNSQAMVYDAINGMLGSLNDPYTTFFTPAQNQSFRQDIEGTFSGIGVELVNKNGYVTVVAPIPDTPAEKAGLKPKDIISKVNDKSVSDMSIDQIVGDIRGEAGTKVKIEVVRQDASGPLVFEIERAKISVKSVTWEKKTVKNKTIYVVKIRQFGDDTDQLFQQFADEAVKNHADGIVLDLRNDPGGYLETAINVSSYFVDSGVIVSEEGKNRAKKDYTVTSSPILKNIKTVVLVNGGSASASEITAGALRDRRNVQLIGETTFGKGCVQELIDLPGGSAVKITVANWFTPNGTQISGAGLKPDITQADDQATDTDEQLDVALTNVVK